MRIPLSSKLGQRTVLVCLTQPSGFCGECLYGNTPGMVLPPDDESHSSWRALCSVEQHEVLRQSGLVCGSLSQVRSHRSQRGHRYPLLGCVCWGGTRCLEWVLSIPIGCAAWEETIVWRKIPVLTAQSQEKEKQEGTNQKESCCSTSISCEINGEPGRAVKWREPRFCNVLFELTKKIEDLV